VALARSRFALASAPAVEVVIDDAARYVANASGAFDLVVVDVFVDVHIPPAVRSAEFLRHARDRLRPGGLLVYNQVAGGLSLGFEALAFTDLARDVLGAVDAIPIRGNLVLLHERGPA
jgi:spermidine synthase